MRVHRAVTVPRLLQLGGMLLANLLPLVAMLPVVHDSSRGTVSVDALLPWLVLPTVLVAAYFTRPIVLVTQVAAASAVIAVATASTPLQHAPTPVGAACMIIALCFATVLVHRLRAFIVAYLIDLREAGSTDALTGILNRRGLERSLPALRAAAELTGDTIGLALVDLDHFKSINDTHGHDVGDQVLRDVTALAAAAVGDRGQVARTGGEEILMVTHGDAAAAAHALEAALQERAAVPGITVSIGIADVAPDRCVDEQAFWAAVARADDALYRAKRLGRNRIERASADAERRAHDRPGTAAETPDAAGVAVEERSVRAAPSPAPGAGQSLAADQLFGTSSRAGAAQRFRPVTRADRRLYTMIAVFLAAVGIAGALSDVIRHTVSPIRSIGVLALGLLIVGAVIGWLRSVRMAHRLRPALIVANAAVLVIAFLVPADSQVVGLFSVALIGLVVVSYWSGAFLLAHVVITAVVCLAAAWVADRPAGWIAAVAAVSIASLVAALMVVRAQLREREKVETELYWRSVTDPLTGLGNRRALNATHAQWRSGQVLIADIDGFKRLNDDHGHAHGDRVLRSVAVALDRLARSARREMRAFRIGGDEFAVAVPGTAPIDLAGLVQAAVAAEAPSVTVTVGLGSWPARGARGLWEALTHADLELIERKHQRRDHTHENA